MVALLPREYHMSIEIRQSCSIKVVPQSNEESIPRQKPICKKDSTLSTRWDTRGWQGLCSKKGVRFNSSRGRLRRILPIQQSHHSTDKCNCCTAALSSFSPETSAWQNSRTSV